MSRAWRRAAGLGAAIVLAAAAGIALTPNDPGFAQDPACPAGGPVLPDPRCAGPSGQWNLLSFWFNSAPEPGHASGISADLAWDVTTGRPDVVVAVLDTGVNYDHEDLRNKIWLNCGELPAPQDAGGQTQPGSSPGCHEPASTYDRDGDGALSVLDYGQDPRIDDVLTPGFRSRTDLRVFADGLDQDQNGFPDDLSGWDARDGDGDEYPNNGDGHGTARNGYIGAETGNGAGIAGICPACRLATVRVDHSFVTRTEGPGIGAIWAADHGFDVIVMALGATTASTFTREAFDYATRRNVLAVSATANEFSFHHNFQTVFDDVVAIGAVVPDAETFVTTYLRKGNFSNYGAHIDVVGPSDAPTTLVGGGYGDSTGTSSAVPHAGGVAGLVISRGRELIAQGALDVSGLALRDLSAQEVRQILNATARDVVMADDPLGPYPYRPGWDRFTGYGRLDARAAVDRVAPGTLPPEADIDAPDWYTKVHGTVDVAFYANARWASSMRWDLEVGDGLEPVVFQAIASQAGVPSDRSLSSASLADNFHLAWNTDSPALADGFYTLRLRVSDDLGNTAEDRMGIWIRRPDPDDHPGWPCSLGPSLESIASSLVDLDGDNTLEVILSSGDGKIFALREDGSDLPGFPVQTDPIEGLPLCCSEAFDGSAANGEVTVTGASVVGGVSVGDIDQDTVQELCATAYDGRLYCWNADGSRQPGFPVSTDPEQTVDPYTGAQQPTARGAAMIAAPVLGDLDGDGRLELVAGAFDQKLYVWRSDGSRLAPWPLLIHDPAQSPPPPNKPRPILSMPVVADIDADGRVEIVFGTNEAYAQPNYQGLTGGSGRLYAYEADGSLETGWPVKPTSLSPEPVPLVAEGIGTSPVAADLDGDGTLEIAIGAFLGNPTIYAADGSEHLVLAAANPSPGAGNNGDETTPEGGLGADPQVLYYVGLGAFLDLEYDGAVDYAVGTLGIGIASLAAGSGTPARFDHYLSVWGTGPGAPHKQNFPRVMEDWQFYTGPAVADLGGGPEGLPEVIVSSGGYFVHAFDALGEEPAGWPKHTGQWVVATPLVGDLDGDGHLEVVVATRLGDVHVWDTAGGACATPFGDPAVQWRRAKHDEWASGVLGKDTLRPAAITDLAAQTAGSSVELTLTGVGDDGACGAADHYEVRLIATPDAPVWSEGAPLASVPGGPAGTPVVLALGSLPDGNHTLMGRAFDEAGNGTPVASVLVEIGDSDGDGVANADDNCDFAFNPGQEDGGGIDTVVPDGIGDACQCGDVTADGIVTGQDGVFITRFGLGFDDPLFAVPGNCDVTGNGACNGQDGLMVTRAALALPTGGLFGQACPNADPHTPCPICGP